MNEILTATVGIGAVILGATKLAKHVVSDNKWLPVFNVVIGIAIGIIYALTIIGGEVAIYAWAGAISGLGAGGFYDLQASAKALNNQRKATTMVDEGEGRQD